MACIYKITVGEKEYIGSTTNYKLRMRNHKSHCFNANTSQYNYKIYQAIRENGGKYKTEIIYRLIEGEVLKIKEQEYYDLISPELNYQRPNSSHEYMKNYHKVYNEQYRLDNKEKIKLVRKKHYQDNKISLGEKVMCECGRETNRANLAKHRKTKVHQDLLNY